MTARKSPRQSPGQSQKTAALGGVTSLFILLLLAPSPARATGSETFLGCLRQNIQVDDQGGEHPTLATDSVHQVSAHQEISRRRQELARRIGPGKLSELDLMNKKDKTKLEELRQNINLLAEAALDDLESRGTRLTTDERDLAELLPEFIRHNDRDWFNSRFYTLIRPLLQTNPNATAADAASTLLQSFDARLGKERRDPDQVRRFVRDGFRYRTFKDFLIDRAIKHAAGVSFTAMGAGALLLYAKYPSWHANRSWESDKPSVKSVADRLQQLNNLDPHDPTLGTDAAFAQKYIDLGTEFRNHRLTPEQARLSPGLDAYLKTLPDETAQNAARQKTALLEALTALGTLKQQRPTATRRRRTATIGWSTCSPAAHRAREFRPP